MPIEPILASRSAPMSWTAPNACDAIPQQKNAVSAQTATVSTAPPASTSPNTAGPAKCVLEVTESSTGRSLNRSTGAE